ncbi:LppP/LprE family lipoprotein [Leucobacter insecticola]|uniref:LppP/LprE family lipoprotein n=1 Tax=Leucobacter insecticola TaxID=2714934 RepID=A0A6G8FFQ4_9MICO|nr:LppP/LprE family lipoprotein [Leucobacter insecticola]QIM15168.1 LppP/LprE family lipoprotein [Leucobacter insecticola]
MNATAKTEADAFAPNASGATVKETGLDSFLSQAGPIAREAMAKAVAVKGCSFNVYFTNGLSEWVAEVSQADQVPLIAGLRESDYVESQLGEALRFNYTEEGDPNAFLKIDTHFTYIFIGDIWISIIGNGQLDYDQAALDGVLAANPSLSGESESRSSKTITVQKCGGDTAQEAMAKWAATVERGPWDLTGQFSELSGYDTCASLSWIVLRPEPCCTRFNITPVLLFHYSEYVGLATKKPYAVEGEIRRLGADTISVTYMWPGDDPYGTANTAISTFAWDEKSGSITRQGNLPPS